MEVINTAWLNVIYELAKNRISAMDSALERAKAEDSKNVAETETAFEWTNYIGTKKTYSKQGMAELKKFVEMYNTGMLNCNEWENNITERMWREIAIALYYCDNKLVHVGISFPDVRDYVFGKMFGQD